MTATHPMRRPEGLRRILKAFGVWRRLRRAEQLLDRSVTARQSGNLDLAERCAAEASAILRETRAELPPG